MNLDPITLKVKVSPMLIHEITRWSREPLFFKIVRSGFEPGTYPMTLRDGDEVELMFHRPEAPKE